MGVFFYNCWYHPQRLQVCLNLKSRLMFILTSLWEVVAFTDLVVQRARTHNRNPSSKFLKTHKTASARGFNAHFTHGPVVRGSCVCGVVGELLVGPQKLLNRAQRSTQPWILLFSLETLICNRSPLPPFFPSLHNYLILFRLWELSYFFPTTLADRKLGFSSSFHHFSQ